MASRARTTPAVVGLVLALALAVSGCDDAGPSAPPSGTPSGSSGAPTDAGTPSGPAPATGVAVSAQTATYHLPADVPWQLSTSSGTNARYTAADGTWIIHLSEPGHQDTATLDDALEIFHVGRPGRYDPPLRRGPDRTVDGTLGFTAQTTTANPYDKSLKTRYLGWGTIHHGDYVYLEVSGPPDDPRTQEWFDAVLASLTWK